MGKPTDFFLIIYTISNTVQWYIFNKPHQSMQLHMLAQSNGTRTTASYCSTRKYQYWMILMKSKILTFCVFAVSMLAENHMLNSFVSPPTGFQFLTVPEIRQNQADL